MDGNEDTPGNVIRLPRDWVGPPEELVPIGSRARVRAREETEEREGRARDETSDDPVFDAKDFWGESASAVHHAMRAPTEPATGDPESEAQAPGRRRPMGARRVNRRAAALVVVAVAAVAVVAIIGVGEGPAPTPAITTQARVPEPAPSHRRLTPDTDRLHATTGRTVAATVAPERSFSERRSVRRPTPGHRHVVRDTQRRSDRLRSAATARGSAVDSTVTAPTATTLPTTPVVHGTTPSATVARDGTTVTTGAGGRSGQSSPQPSGPLGPGYATGCDAKCS